MKNILFTLIFSSFCLLGQSQNFGIFFDGENDQLTVCDSDDFDIGSEFTIEAWINAREWRADSWQGTIISKDNADVSGFAFRAGRNGTLNFALGAESGDWPEIETDPFMNANQWYHVAVVKTGNDLQLFVNGNLITSSTFIGEPAHNNSIMKIGESSGFAGRQWNGWIDEVRIWNVARTPLQITDNQTTSFTGNEAGLVTYFPMNEGTSDLTANLVLSDCSANFSTSMDESNWTEGWSVARSDVGVVNLTAPDAISIFNKPVKMQAVLQNYGSEAISNIPVNVIINGLPAFSQTFNITLQPGELKEVVFERVVDLTDNSTNLINISTDHPEDANTLNNAVIFRYRKPNDGRIVNILNEERYNFGSAGQTKFTNVNLPVNVEDFEKLLLHISIECPSTGCDPWDQPARLSVDTDEGSFEIARFITPYGQGCGPWTVDVTDFKSILKGGVTFKSFVQVWGPSGWLVNADLEYIQGDTPQYQKLTTLWESDNWVYGDPNVSYDLPERTIMIEDNTESNHMRMTITGHGQGNTDNGAEFSNKSHNLYTNGELIDVHSLWRSDCAQNVCADQAGTWTLSRAGWCPGQEVTPYLVNTTSLAPTGQPFTIDYELEEYTNLLNTGYNGGSHTEPHYKIFSYFVEGSSERFTDFTNLRAEKVSILTNGNAGNPAITGLDFIIQNTGTVDVSNAKLTYYVNEEFAFEETLSVTIAAGDSYTHSFSNITGFELGDDNLVFAIVSSDNDENISDDATKASINDELVSVNNLSDLFFNVSPNPSNGLINITVSEDFLNGEMQVMDLLGRVALQQEINNLEENLVIKDNGVYMLVLTSKDGLTQSKKLVIE